MKSTVFIIFFLFTFPTFGKVSKTRGPNSYWPQACSNTPSTLEELNTSSYSIKAEESSSLSYPQNGTKPQFVAIVVHGLNLRPSKMKAFENLLHGHNAITLRVALEGHRGSLEEQKHVTWQKWQQQYHDHFCLAQSLAKKHSVPLINLSFSLGALVSLGHVGNQENWPYLKTIFIAPAAWIHWYGNIPSWFNFLGGGIGIPSKNLKEYRSQATTSLAAYEAMANGRNEIEEMPSQLLKNETLIIMDPNDELVSLKKIKQFLNEKNIQDFWDILEVSNKETTLKKSYHHLIVDEKSLGANQWKALQERLSAFLTGTSLP